jgi:hypothetical protein
MISLGLTCDQLKNQLSGRGCESLFAAGFVYGICNDHRATTSHRIITMY